ncbi:hypothetical protein AMECASPLE_007580 [Ameca splendens]|uniref:Uncharacterized protein n=1 Tax=Ameca splendens TaxID=208324 RepID=A0ABV0XCW3_9TELE
MVVCTMTLMMRKMKRTKWCRLKKKEGCVAFREELRQVLGSQEVLPGGWTTTANATRETGRKVLGMPSGRKVYKETWWWNEEVQEWIRRKRSAKKWDTVRTEESHQEYRETQGESQGRGS